MRKMYVFIPFLYLERQQCALQQQLLGSFEGSNPLQQLALAQQQVQANVMANAMLQQQQQNAANNHGLGIYMHALWHNAKCIMQNALFLQILTKCIMHDALFLQIRNLKISKCTNFD